MTRTQSRGVALVVALVSLVFACACCSSTKTIRHEKPTLQVRGATSNLVLLVVTPIKPKLETNETAEWIVLVSRGEGPTLNAEAVTCDDCRGGLRQAIEITNAFSVYWPDNESRSFPKVWLSEIDTQKKGQRTAYRVRFAPFCPTDVPDGLALTRAGPITKIPVGCFKHRQEGSLSWGIDWDWIAPKAKVSAALVAFRPDGTRDGVFVRFLTPVSTRVFRVAN